MAYCKHRNDTKKYRKLYIPLRSNIIPVNSTMIHEFGGEYNFEIKRYFINSVRTFTFKEEVRR
jgi:hypothetical protein